MHLRQNPHRGKHTQSSASLNAAEPLLEPLCFKNTAYRDCLSQLTIYSRMHAIFAVLFGGAIYKTYQTVSGDLDVLLPGIPESDISLLFTYLRKRVLNSEAFERYQHARLVPFFNTLEMYNFQLMTFYSKGNRNVIKMNWNGVHLDLIISHRTVAEHASNLDLSVGALYWDICRDTLYSPYPLSLRDFQNKSLDLLFPEQAFEMFSRDPSVLLRIVRAVSSSEFSISLQLKKSIKEYVAAHDNLFEGDNESRANRLYHDLKLLFSLGLAKKNIEILMEFELLLPLFGYLKTLSPESKALTMHLIDSILQEDCTPLVGLYYAIHWMAIKAEPYALERVSSFACPKINFPVGEFNPETDARYRSQLALLETTYFHDLASRAIGEHSPMLLSFGDFPAVEVLPVQEKKKKNKKKKEALNEVDWFLMGKNSADDRHQALECFAKAIAMNPSHVPSHYECIQIKRQLGQQGKDNLICHYNSILAISKSMYQTHYESHYGCYEDFIFSMHCERGSLYLEQRKYKDAERDFTAANGYHLPLPDAFCGLGAIAAQQALDLFPAIAAALLMKEQATEKKLKQQSDANHQRQLAILDDKFHSAIHFYNRALEIRPGDEKATIALADIQRAQTDMLPGEQGSTMLKSPILPKKKKKKSKKASDATDESSLRDANLASKPEPDFQFENGVKHEHSGRYIEAIKCYKDSFAMHQKIKSLHKAIDVDLFLGLNKDALEACQLLLNISEESFQSVYSPHQESPFDDYAYHRFYAFYQRGRVYETCEHATDAIKDFSHMIDAWQSMQDQRYPDLVVLTYIRLGYVMHAQARSRRQTILAAELNPTLRVSGLETTAMRQTAMSDVLFQELEVGKAFAYAENLMTCFCPELSHKRHEIYLGLGKIAQEKRLADEAKSYYQQCLSVIRALNPLGVFKARESVDQIFYQCAEYISGVHINQMLRGLVQHHQVSIAVTDLDFIMLSLSIYIEAIEHAPAVFIHAHIRQIEIDIILKKYPEAILRIESMLNADLTKTKSSKRELFCLLGFGYECNGDDEKAKENYLKAAVMYYQDDNEAKAPLIKISQENLKRIKEKIKQNKRLKSNLRWQRQWNDDVSQHIQEKKFSDVVHLCNEAIASYPNHLMAYQRRAYAHVLLKNYAAAMEDCLFLESITEEEYARLYQPNEMRMFDGYKNSRCYCFNLLGATHALHQEYDQAIAYYKRAIELYNQSSPSEMLPAMVANSYSDLGKISLMNDEVCQAKQYYLQSLALFEDKETYWRLAKIEQTLGDLDAAHQYYQQYILHLQGEGALIPEASEVRKAEHGKAAPDDNVWFLRGEAYREGREYQNAADAYCKVIEINPYHLKAQWRQIEMHIQLKQFRRVIQRAKGLIELSKDNYERLCQSTQIPPLNDYAYHQGYARYQRAHAYVSLKQYEQAAVDYDYIIQMSAESVSSMLSILKIQSKKNLDSCHEKMQPLRVVSDNRHILFTALCLRPPTSIDRLTEFDSKLKSQQKSDIC